MIPQNFIQEIVDKTDIIELIGGYLALKKSGANHWARCPFHNEKTPSFSVNAVKNVYHCFGCGAHGNAIGFLMEHQGLNFIEAVSDLAGRLGLDVPSDQNRNAHSIETIKQLEWVLQKSLFFYKEELKKSQPAINFLKARGLTGSVAGSFNLGFAPNKINALKSVFKNYENNETLIRAGLVLRTENAKFYDRFRDRVIFPIHNAKGNLVGFGGRVISDRNPKYLNSPETPLFSKGKELYGLHGSRAGIQKEKKVVVVEGYMDVLALAQYGINCAVATLGTATSEHQIKNLLNRVDHIVFAFDGDEAGSNAAVRAMESCLPVIRDGKFISFCFFPSGEDPDSFVRKHGADNFWEHLDQACPLSEFLISKSRGSPQGVSDESRAKYLRDIKQLIRKIKAPNFALIMKKRVSELLNIPINQLGFDQDHIKNITPANLVQKKASYRIIDTLLAILSGNLEVGTTIKLSDAKGFNSFISRLANQEEWGLFQQLINLSKENQINVDLIEKFRGTEYEPLLKKAHADGVRKEILNSQELKIEFKGAWDRFIRQLKDAKIENLLRKKDLSIDDKKELLQLQKKDSN